MAAWRVNVGVGYTHMGSRGLRRYGTLDDLLTWAVSHSEMKTLQHGLSEAGPRGRAALQRLCSVLESPGAVLFAGLSAESRLAFVYRGQLVLGHPDEAGAAPLSLPCPHCILIFCNGSVRSVTCNGSVQSVTCNGSVCSVFCKRLCTPESSSLALYLASPVSDLMFPLLHSTLFPVLHSALFPVLPLTLFSILYCTRPCPLYVNPLLLFLQLLSAPSAALLRLCSLAAPPLLYSPLHHQSPTGFANMCPLNRRRRGPPCCLPAGHQLPLSASSLTRVKAWLTRDEVLSTRDGA